MLTKMKIMTPNFYIVSQAKAVALGLCNQEIVYSNNSIYRDTNALGSGTYLWNSGGYFWQSTSTTYNNVYNGKRFGPGDILGVTYTSTNNSIQFHQNQNYFMTVPIDRIKNLNFCVSFESTSSVVNLVY